MLPFFVCISEGIIIFNTSLRIKDLGGDEFIIGLAPTLRAVLMILFCMVSGRLSDTFGRERIFHTGLIVQCLAILGLGLSDRSDLLIAFTGIYGVGSAFLWPVLGAYIADISGQREFSDNLLAYNISWSSGIFAGVLIAGRLRDFSEYIAGAGTLKYAASYLIKGIPFFVAVLPAVIAVVTGYTFVHLKKKKREPAARKVEPMTKLQRVFLLIGFFVTAGTIFNSSIIWWLFPKFATDITISSTRAGLFLSMVAVAEIITFAVIRITRPNFNSPFYLIPFILMNIGCFAILSIPSNEMLLAHQFLFGTAALMMGTAVAGCFSYSQYHTLLHPHARGTKSGIHQSILVTGALGGSFFGGLAARLTGSSRAPFALGMTLAGFLIVAQFFVRMALTGKNGET